ncbi:GspH/FimT family pseudopilin [Aliikangiella coralliicola]|uniref:Type II secretion system protein H n=1 Tax=Aliikangiella coralliicola TaxID=2592383 RepID=A0A545U0J3_9GAMM|nr:GspH/FimT family pseudopilin [Aliikangiella coralliicola]TQV82989.1 hypothetical protein FLL46_24785 [Aliikangiella coralliicola]
MAHKKQSAFTLIDILFTLGLVAVLLNIALPAFDDLIKKQKITSEVMKLRTTLQNTRSIAITRHQKVTICPTLDGASCSKKWSDGYMAFVDNNSDRKLSADEELLHQSKIKDDDIQLRWRAFGVRTSFQWHHTGITNHQNGTFEYCFKNEPELSRALIISKAGRIRHSKDKNGNRIHENARDEDISC